MVTMGDIKVSGHGTDTEIPEKTSQKIIPPHSSPRTAHARLVVKQIYAGAYPTGVYPKGVTPGETKGAYESIRETKAFDCLTSKVATKTKEMFYDLARRCPKAVSYLLNDPRFELTYSVFNNSNSKLALYEESGKVCIHRLPNPNSISDKIEFCRVIIGAWNDLKVSQVHIAGSEQDTTICCHQSDIFVKQNEEGLRESLEISQAKLKEVERAKPGFNPYKKAYWDSVTSILKTKDEERLRQYFINAVSFYIEDANTRETLAKEDSEVCYLAGKFAAEYLLDKTSIKN